MENNEKTSTGATQKTTSKSGRQLLLVMVPNLATGDQHSLSQVDQVFGQVGTIQRIQHGIFVLETDQPVSTWADNVRSTMGNHLNFSIIPIDQSRIADYVDFVPTSLRSLAQANLKVAS